MAKTENPTEPRSNLFRELYFSVFMLFYSYFSRQWSQDMNAVKGAIGITIVEGLLLLSAVAWAEISRHSHLVLNHVILVGISLAIYAGNTYMLVVRGDGIAFEQEFKRFRKGKRITLYVIAIVIVVVTAGIFCFSALSYRRTWNAH